jgi:hypothetical protein
MATITTENKNTPHILLHNYTSCLFHLRSDWIVTPRYFVEDSVWRVCWWSTYLWCIVFFLVVMCMTIIRMNYYTSMDSTIVGPVKMHVHISFHFFFPYQDSHPWTHNGYTAALMLSESVLQCAFSLVLLLYCPCLCSSSFLW